MLASPTGSDPGGRFVLGDVVVGKTLASRS
jgi:hypothetical protein